MKQLIKAVLKVMEECEGIDKSLTVGSGRSSYKGVSDKDVKLKVGGSMRKHGLVLFPTKVTPTHQVDRWEEDDTYNKNPPYPKKTKQSVFTEVATEYLLCHESGESITLAGLGHGVDPQDKASGKATTYAMKYTLLYTFMVATGHIDDSDKTHSDDVEAPKPTATKKSAPLKPLTDPILNNIKEKRSKDKKEDIDKDLNAKGYKSLSDIQYKEIRG